MKSRIILESIQPFNEVYYKSCFYNSLFPVINHFKKSIIPILINDSIVYKYDRGKKQLDMEFIPYKTIHQLIDEIGISAETKICSDRVIEDIVSSISNQMPIIIWVDCFYESIRNDTYLKLHLPHTWLVYGYDQSEQICNIIEHRQYENLSYEKMIISYTDVINCYQGYTTNFKQETSDPDFFSFYLEEKTSVYWEPKLDIHTSIFIENFLRNKINFIKGFDDLRIFTGDFTQIVMNENSLKENVQMLLKMTNNIINTKKIEKYRFAQLKWQQLYIMELLDAILDNWAFIRANIARFLFSSRYKQGTFRDAVDKLNLIYQLEYNVIKNILL